VRDVHSLAQTWVTTGRKLMLKTDLAMPMIALGVLLAAPATAQDIIGPRAGDVLRVRQAPNLDIQPRGQRDQMVPGGDSYSTEEPDDDLDEEVPAGNPPVDRRL
jgi:hypothetical protein